jgi:2-polyprenyl-6-methoxyphenol hydroxylase-like FAD-dependent oxidoreductase
VSILETSVVIVGGGVAGGSLACALAHRGIPSILIERLKAAVDLNRGDGMQPRSLEIMEEWGLLPTFIERGALPTYGSEVHHPALGQLVEIDLSVVKTKHPYLLNLPHPQIEALLLEHAQASGYCKVIRGAVTEVLYADGRATGVKAKTDDGELTVMARLVAGADGSQSMIRKSAGIDAPAQPYAHDMLVLHAKRPKWFTGRLRTRAYMNRKGAVVLLPLPNDNVRIAMLVEAGSGAKFRNLSTEALHHELTDRLPLLSDLQGLERHGEHLYRMQKMHVTRYADKGVVLLGDSAHVTHPAAGQGMNMALQDADTLAAEIARALKGGGRLDEALVRYEGIRRPINQGVIDRANFMAWQLWAPSIPAFVGRTLYAGTLKYLLPFIYRRITASIAWGVAGVTPQA